ncbi:uncharacterized protein LOC143845947 [Tasmannia lanceolata]|uniref:uncharacterized protein LOC143845947 n=1 Tax=Tasmannia lanceolata TaxID=3420 RepID=UPI004063800D
MCENPSTWSYQPVGFNHFIASFGLCWIQPIKIILQAKRLLDHFPSVIFAGLGSDLLIPYFSKKKKKSLAKSLRNEFCHALQSLVRLKFIMRVLENLETSKHVCITWSS